MSSGWVAVAPAQCVRDIYAVDSGWYDATGAHYPDNQYYLVGDSSVPGTRPPYRNWFVFPIPALGAPVASAALEIFSHEVGSVTGAEWLQLREVTTPVEVLRAGGPGLTGIYNDLGDGTVFGGLMVSPVQARAMVTIPLNADFVAALEAAQGGMLALGGEISTLDSTPANDEYIFGAGLTSPLPGVYVRLHVSYEVAAVPFFLSEPVSAHVAIGGSALLASSACGAPPLSFRWLFNGTNLPGPTGGNLLLSNVGVERAGDYQVVATGPGGAATSVVARVTVSPIVIRTQLVSQTVLLGNPLTLRVRASGRAPLAYAWMKDGVLLSISASEMLALPSVGPGDAGDYWVVITNVHGAATSEVARVTVETRAPVFVVQPTNTTVAPGPGKIANFYALAEGGPPPTYQWFHLFQGAPVPGATSSNLVIADVGFDDAGDYWVVAANDLGAVTSAVARLTVRYFPPTIYQQPQSQVVDAGGTVSLSVGATGDPAPSYQWYHNGSPVPGASANYLQRFNVSSNEAGAYLVVVTNLGGAVTSEVATVTLRYRGPQFVSQPASQSVLAGSNVSLDAYANGPLPIEYQWQFNEVDIPEARYSSLFLPQVTTNEAGRYRVVARNEYGSTVSTTAVLTVRLQAPRFVLQPQGHEVAAGSTAILYGRAEAGPPPVYQWLFNGEEIPGAMTDTLVLFNVTPQQGGSYTLVASNELGSETSAAAVLSVTVRAPEFVVHPISQTVRAGEFLYLNSVASGAPQPSYQWRRDGIDIPGAFYSSFILENISPSQAGAYTVVAENSAGSATSQVAVVIVTVEPPQFISHPQSATVGVGNDVELFGEATGAPPPLYQWLRDGRPIPRATDRTLPLWNVTTNQTGNYSLVASNLAGVRTSAVAVLTVRLIGPEFLEHPRSQEVLAGTQVFFSGQASGGPPPAYQWLFNGAKLAGQTASDLVLYNVSPEQAGNYALVAKNPVGAATSRVAVLTVEVQAPFFTGHPESRSLLVGEYLQLSASAVGAPGPVFTWLKDGSVLPRETSPYFYRPAAQLEDSGRYQVIASNVAGLATSLVAVVTVTTAAPRFVQQPMPQTVWAGDTAAFFGSAVGGPPPSYQWQWNGENIPDATSGSLYLYGVGTHQAGSYTLIARNPFGVATSEVALLTVTVRAPRFDVQPQNHTALAGHSVQLLARASGAPPPSYQWWREGIPLAAATNEVLGFLSAGLDDTGSYSVTASNVAGMATSRVARLTVQTRAPFFLSQPSDQVANAGSSISFWAQADGGPPPAYQWLFNGEVLSGETNGYLHFNEVSPERAGGYAVVAGNELGSVTSRVARLTVITLPPNFVSQPLGRTALAGDYVIFSAYAEGAPMPQYQWFFNDMAIPASGGPSLYLANVQLPQAGGYYAVASNAFGMATSQVAVLTVELLPPYFELEPRDQAVLVGENVSFESFAAGAPAPRYRWQTNGIDLPGRTDATLYLYQVDAQAAGRYTVIASNVAGVATSQVAILTVSTQAPEFIEDPQNETVNAGGSVRFSAAARAGPPPTYQWLFNGRPIAGATGTALNLGPVATNQAGRYSLMARNPYGAATSAVATLTVRVEAPWFELHPSAQEVYAGEQVRLQAWASGAPPPAYQWHFNGVPIPGARLSELWLPDVTTNQAGSYLVVASNFLGVVTSRVAVLTVRLAAPEFVAQPQDLQEPIGGVATFYAQAVGGPAPTYQWRFQGTELAEATGEYLSFSVLSTNQAGGYSVVARNSLGAVTSRVATLEVELRAPQFFTEPSDQDALLGQVVDFYAGAQGSPPPDYQWLFRGSPLPNETNQWLRVVGSSTNAAGPYAVVAQNFLGAVTSRLARLTLRLQGPVITRQPDDIEAGLESDASFCVGVEAGPPATYQWQFNGGDLAGATNVCLELRQVATNQAGSYRVVASNPLGVVTSAVATLTVVGLAPELYTQPEDTIALEGMDVRFTALAYGIPTPRVSLLFNGTNLPFARPDHSDVLLLSEVTTNDAGLYALVASNRLGMVVSRTARLTVVPAGPLDRWTRLNPRPTVQDLSAISHAAGLYVAVGTSGTILISSNATEWHERSLRTGTALRGVTFGAGKFVVLGDRGLIGASTNGLDWTPHGNEESDWQKVTYADGRFVAVGGASGFVLVSPDGLTWTRHALPNYYHRFLDVTWGRGVFVAVADSGATFTSADGVAWQGFDRAEFGRGSLRSVIYGPDKFVAVGSGGRVATSGDGLEWSDRYVGPRLSLSGVAYGHDRYVAVGVGGTILNSTDGTNWVRIDSGTGVRLDAVSFADDRFIATGQRGTILVSSNGLAWQEPAGLTRHLLWDLVSGQGQLVVVGEGGTILTSTDGEHFTRRESGVSQGLRGVAYGEDRFVAVGGSGTVLSSTDGQTWALQQLDPGSHFQSVTYGDGRWIALGQNGVVITSTDARQWSPVASPTEGFLSSVAYGAGAFVAVGNTGEGAAFVTRDGFSWQSVNLYVSAPLRSVIFSGGRFVALGGGGQWLSSPDGEQWEMTEVDDPGFRYYAQGATLTHARGYYLATAFDGTILTSRDTANWTRRISRTFDFLTRAHFFRGRFIAVGAGGTILRSGPPGPELRGEPSGEGFHVLISGEPGERFQLQASDDLMTWEDLGMVELAEGEVSVVDPGALGRPHRFYRLAPPGR